MSTIVPRPDPVSFAPASGRRERSHVLAGPFKVGIVLVGGAVLGLAATAWVLDRKADVAAVAIGPWVTWAKVGTVGIDPYARAIYARTGEIALAAAEGIAFTAMTDSAGKPLSTRCAYRIKGPFPMARYWTLTATTPGGDLMDNGAKRGGFVSTEILRRDDGAFAILASPSVRPGNWLPVSGNGRFVLTLRLYDSPLAAVVGDIGKITAMPALTPLGCAS